MRKPDGRRPLTISRCMWEDNFKINLKEICRRGVDSGISGKGGVLAYENLRVTQKARNLLIG